MKNKFINAFTYILAIIFLFACGTSTEKKSEASDELEGEITISGSFALYPLAIKWAEEFQKIYPNVIIDVTAGGTGKGVSDALANAVDLGMMGREVNDEEIKNGAWIVAVTKDAVIPSGNTNNPELANIFKKGINSETFKKIYVSNEFTTWGQVVGTDNNAKIEIFKRSDAGGVTEAWAKFLKSDYEQIKGIGIFGDPGVAEAVKKNPNGIGFNNTLYIYDATTRKPYDGISPLPIDVNNNGILDPNENFYGSLDSLTAAINDGRYPSPPSRNLYFLSKGKPTNKLVIAFLKWTLTEGQKFCKEAGYINLPTEMLDAEATKLQ
jgi:phosphate transport system substrate-binding protein